MNAGYSGTHLINKLGIKPGYRLAFVQALATNGMLWMSWPKRVARRPTDLEEDAVRATGLAHGLVDVKVIAVDAVWSGLKFVYRLRDRR